jgi:hypothetical protein
MGILTLVRFLFGDRQAILQLAANRATVPIGFLFVLSAGFAREYDGEDLWHEPWHLLLPLGASVAASFLLFCLAMLGTSRHEGPSFFAAYRSFLGLFWMTAPLAWLYAIPYERFLGPVDAMGANLISLGIVAAWRVILMTRLLVVLCNFDLAKALFRVLAFADAVALAALNFVPVPLLDLMSGIRLSDRDKLLQEIARNIGLLGGCSAPIWFIGAFATGMVSVPGRWQASVQGAERGRPTWPLEILGLTSVGIWAAILPFTQPEQQLRRQVEQDFNEGRIASALATMSAHLPADFPPHWLPPPRFISRYGDRGSLLDIVAQMQRMPTAPWVREIYLRKLRDQWNNARSADHDELWRLARLLAHLPEGDDILKEMEQNEHASYFLELKAMVREVRFEK